MTSELYERVRRTLFGGHNLNVLVKLLMDRSAIQGPIQGTPEEFSQVLYELTDGELETRNESVSYEVVVKRKRDILKFRDGSRFRVVKAKGTLGEALIVITPDLPSMEDLVEAKELPLARLVTDTLQVRDAYKRIADEYRREKMRVAADKAAAEIRIARESRLDTVLETVEKAKNGTTIMVRGLQNIDEMIKLGFVPSLVDNPDNWVDAEDFPGLQYHHARSGVEMLLTGRERFRPIEELNRLEFVFLVHRSDSASGDFEKMARKFRGTKPDGTPYSTKEFHADLLALVKYPEELKGRTEADLGLVADEVGYVIDRRQELDKGILPYEAVFRRDTRAIIEHIRVNRTPAREIRKALDYFEYTGMIDGQYRMILQEQIDATTAARPAAPTGSGDILYDKRVKEIVADVLRKIPKERLTSRTITIALTPYVNELGFSRLVKIRERILQLKEMMRDE
jgi:hypothetical protein